MAVDVFIDGLRTSSRPGKGPRLELVFSHAGGSRTVGTVDGVTTVYIGGVYEWQADVAIAAPTDHPPRHP